MLQPQHRFRDVALIARFNVSGVLVHTEAVAFCHRTGSHAEVLKTDASLPEEVSLMQLTQYLIPCTTRRGLVWFAGGAAVAQQLRERYEAYDMILPWYFKMERSPGFFDAEMQKRLRLPDIPLPDSALALVDFIRNRPAILQSILT